jgi:hypothetical protein
MKKAFLIGMALAFVFFALSPPAAASCSVWYRCAYGGIIACHSNTPNSCFVDAPAETVYCGSSVLTCAECFPRTFCDI